MEFNFNLSQKVYFGPGKLSILPDLVSGYGKKMLLITSDSFLQSTHQEKLFEILKQKKIHCQLAKLSREPSPEHIDTIVENFKNDCPDMVVAVGGGSVLDAGKAVSAMLLKNESVLQYLEGVGSRIHDGQKIPFAAVPTTSGTGSEATKNAVISKVGQNGFKKSLRHDNFFPDIALLDPLLTTGCPHSITSACGMDALTQLLESLVSTQASRLTDALAYSGLEGFGDALVTSSLYRPDDISARTILSYGAYISGVTLANAGLGVVHGFASVIGGFFHAPHGVVCGTLLAETTRQTVDHLLKEQPGSPALEKYAKAGQILRNSQVENSIKKDCFLLVDFLQQLTGRLDIPALRKFKLTKDHIDKIVDQTAQKYNPVKLSDKILVKILNKRI